MDNIVHILYYPCFHMGAYFCMGAYKHDVVVVIKMDAYIHGCLFCVGAYYSSSIGQVCLH